MRRLKEEESEKSKNKQIRVAKQKREGTYMTKAQRQRQNLQNNAWRLCELQECYPPAAIHRLRRRQSIRDGIYRQ
jgi:thiamine kinase-like enzyme